MAVVDKVLFHLTDDALIVANSGEPFIRKGVIAICHMHLGNKGEEKPQDNYGSDLIREIGKSVIGAYQHDDNLVAEQMKGEKALGGDYNGRSIWELLQNADDAATLAALGADSASGGLIGAKGLGFKSILEFSESPEIYSGNFQFRFSREDTQNTLDREKVKIQCNAPIFRIPHQCQPNKQCAALLKGGYATVIRLPFIGDKAEKAEERLNELDASCLLFCQRLSRIEIKIRDKSRVIAIDRNGVFGFENGKATFTLKENGEIRKWRRWSAAWTPENTAGAKKLSAALCLPIVENEETATNEERPVHVFFPTNQQVHIPGLKALIHASYELQSNREHLDNEQPHGTEILGKIGGLASDILMDIPAAAALRVFGEISPTTGNAGNPEIARLQNAFSNAVAQTPFVPIIGGEKVRPADVRIWKHRLGEVVRGDHSEVREAKLLTLSLSAEQDVCNTLITKLNAKSVPLHEHAKLLRACRKDTLNACYAAWRVAGNIAREAGKNAHIPAQKEDANAACAALKDAPIWWTNGESPRSLNGDIPLLLKRPKDWPEWLNADALAPEFRKMLDNDKAPKKQNDSPTRRDSLKQIGAWPLDSPHAYFTGALLPFCKGKDSEWWEKMGWDVLQWAFRWGGGEVSKLSPSIIGGGDKVNRIDEGIIRLPTGKKGWLPAIECYAGEAWGGPASFDKYFRNVQKRGVVIPMEKWGMPPNMECDKKKWGEFLRGLGVSWGPKVRRVPLNDLPTEIDNLIGKYKQQCLTNIRRQHNRSSADKITGGISTYIEDFPDALAGCTSANVFRAAKSIEQLAKKPGGNMPEIFVSAGQR